MKSSNTGINKNKKIFLHSNGQQCEHLKRGRDRENVTSLFDTLLTLLILASLNRTCFDSLSTKQFRNEKLFISVILEIFGKCFTPDQYKGLSLWYYLKKVNADPWLSLGDCVYFKTCPSLFEIFNKRPASTQDRLFLSLSQCGFRDGQPLVCCREAASVAPPPPAVTTQAPVQQTQSPRNTLLPRPGECGIDAQDRIYGGNETKIDEYPWMALLQYSKRKSIFPWKKNRKIHSQIVN